MNDLLLSILFVTLLAVLAVRLGYRIGKRGPVALAVTQLAALLTMVGFILFLWNRPRFATLLPLTNLIIIGNWLPLWGSFFVGLALSDRRCSVIRRGMLAVVTMSLVCYSVAAPVTGQTPVCNPVSSNVTLLSQTTPFTCSPACAASLLRLYGIQATEGELAELCLTRKGTHWMGVYRGLCLKTQGTEWKVAVDDFSTDLLLKGIQSPSMLAVNIDVTKLNPDEDHGFLSETGHSVICMGPVGEGYVSIFDPSPDFGVEEWDHEILSSVTDGVILRLVPRKSDSLGTLAVQRKLLTARLEHKVASR